MELILVRSSWQTVYVFVRFGFKRCKVAPTSEDSSEFYCASCRDSAEHCTALHCLCKVLRSVVFEFVKCCKDVCSILYNFTIISITSPRTRAIKLGTSITLNGLLSNL